MISEEQQKKDERYMRMALDEAQIAYEAGEIPIGAVVVCKDRIISRAHNLTETLCDVTAHAEMQAITAAANTLGGKYLTDCTLYVTVEPCVMCAGAIGWARDVCRCHRMGPVASHRIWLCRRQTGLPRLRASCHASQSHRHQWRPGRGMSPTDAGLL